MLSLVVRTFALSTLCVTASCAREAPRRAPVRVAAASDLTPAFEELSRAFRAEAHEEVSFSFGASGLLAKQLEQGAPFDVFAAANEAFVDSAVASGNCERASKARYARGRLAIFWRNASKVKEPSSIRELVDPRFVRIAIANPEHAPYGKAAKQALIAAGIWDAVEPHIVYGENVRQTLQLAETGNVELAIAAHALVVGNAKGRFIDVEPSLHAPIDQALVVCSRGPNEEGGRRFAKFVASGEGGRILAKFGFLPPR